MLVPEAPMNKDDLAESRKDKVRCSGKALAMQTKSVAKAMSHRPDDTLGLHSLRAYGPHVGASALRGELIRHPS